MATERLSAENKFLRKIFVILITMFTSANAFAQAIHTNDVVNIVEKARSKFNIPAMAIVVFDSKNVFIKEIKGVRVTGSDYQASLADYFHIGSSAKSILAVLAGRLVEEGKVKWETKFFDVLHELKSSAREEYHNITLNALLSCRAGIQSFTSYRDFNNLNKEQANSQIEFVKYLFKQPPVSDRENEVFEHLYSNPSYTMVALMLERITGASWQELIAEMMEKDLGFSIVFGWPNSLDIEQPWGHTKINDSPYNEWLKLNKGMNLSLDKNELYAFSPDNEFELPAIIAPAGDLSMTPLDYAKYAQLHLQGLRGVSNYIQPETYNTIHYKYPGFSYGLGSAKSWGERFSTYNGSAGTFYSHTMIFPDSDFGYIILTNSGAEETIQGIHWASTKLIKKHFGLWWMFWM